MEFSRPEYYSGWLFPSPGYHLNTGIKPRSLELQADSSPCKPPGKPKCDPLPQLTQDSRKFYHQIHRVLVDDRKHTEAWQLTDTFC